MTFWSRSLVRFLRSAKCNQFRFDFRLNSGTCAAVGKSPFPGDDFLRRHVGPTEEDIQIMLRSVGCKSLQELTDKTVPSSIAFQQALKLDGPKGIFRKFVRVFFTSFYFCKTAGHCCKHKFCKYDRSGVVPAGTQRGSLFPRPKNR